MDIEFAELYLLLVASGKWEELKNDMEEKMRAIKEKQRQRDIEALEREIKDKTQMLGVLKNEKYS